MSTLANVAEIYRLFLKKNEDLTVTMLVNELGMAKSSASRLLKQMAEHGLLERDRNRPSYHPSLLVLELSHLVRSKHPLPDMLLTAITELNRTTGMTCYISKIDEDAIRVVHALVGEQVLQVFTYAGYRLPVTTTSTGKALLSRASSETLQRFLPAEPAGRDQLLQTLSTIRGQGWAASISEAMKGVASVSSAVYDPSTGEALALCLSIPVAQLQPDSIETMATTICQHTSKIGRAIGDPYWRKKAQELPLTAKLTTADMGQ